MSANEVDLPGREFPEEAPPPDIEARPPRPPRNELAAPLWAIAIVLAVVGGFVIYNQLPPDFFMSPQEKAREVINRIRR